MTPTTSHAVPTMPSATRSEFERLVAAHRGILLKIAASYARGYEDRADLAQDILLQLWRAWPRYEPQRPFPTWMYRVALNVAISHRRAQGGSELLEPIDDGHQGLVGAGDVDAEGRQQLELVQRAMQAFGALDRALLVLHLEGCSHREIGEVMGISETNAATRLGRIRQQLRRQVGAGAAQGDPHGND